jgi:hypothetical protein
MKTKEAKDLAKKKIVRKGVRKKPVVKKVKPVVAAEPKVKVEDLNNVEKVQVVLIVLIIAGMFYFGT